MPRWRAQARVRLHRGAVDVAKRKSQILRGVPRRKMPGKVRTRRTSVEQILYLYGPGFDRNGVGLPSLWRGFTMAQGGLRTLPQSGARSGKTGAHKHSSGSKNEFPALLESRYCIYILTVSIMSGPLLVLAASVVASASASDRQSIK